MITRTKHWEELVYHVDVLAHSICVHDDSRGQSPFIYWLKDGTLSFFPYGYYGSEQGWGNLEDFTSLAHLMNLMKRVLPEDDELMQLLSSPVWYVLEEEEASPEDEHLSFNALLGDLQIDL